MIKTADSDKNHDKNQQVKNKQQKEPQTEIRGSVVPNTVPNTREPNTRWSQIELDSEIRIQLSRKIKMLNSLLNYSFIFYQKKVYRSRTAAKCFIRRPLMEP